MKLLSEIRKSKIAVFTFGRMNPPTIGHEKLIKKVLEVANKHGADPFVYVSFTQDPSKNPLTNKQKIKYLKLGIPEAAKAIKEDPKARTPYEALSRIIEQGYEHVIMVVGQDRVLEFKKGIAPYINHPDKKKSFELSKFEVVSAGGRDPDADGVEGMSASKMREAAIKDDFTNFRRGTPSGLSDRFAREMFDLVRKGMRIAEEIIRTQDSLNIPRIEMPQIAQRDIKDFVNELEKEGIPVRASSLSVNNLKPTQREVNRDRIEQKMDSFSKGEYPKPFLVSLDNYILDGHHQLYALKGLGYDKNGSKVPVFVVGLKMADLLKYAHKYGKVSYKKIRD